jgi:hypothetical protein
VGVEDPDQAVLFGEPRELLDAVDQGRPVRVGQRRRHTRAAGRPLTLGGEPLDDHEVRGPGRGQQLAGAAAGVQRRGDARARVERLEDVAPDEREAAVGELTPQPSWIGRQVAERP